MRSNEYLTSADVIGLPLWNFTFLRRVTVSVLPSSDHFHDSARFATTLRSLSNVKSGSYTISSIRNDENAVCLCGSSPLASAARAPIRVPPFFGAWVGGGVAVTTTGTCTCTVEVTGTWTVET